MAPKIDLEFYLRRFVPDLFNLLDCQNVSWSSINKSYIKKHQERTRKFNENGGYLKTELNFYDLVIRTIKDNDPIYIHFFVYVNVVFRMLNKNLYAQEKKLIGSILRNLLNDFTLDHIHSLGELFVLNNVMSRRNLYALKENEHKMKNGKRIDFNIVHKATGQELLSEVMNIRLIGMDLSSHANIKKHIERKIIDKIKDKTRDVIVDFNFFIHPVLWGTADELKYVSDFYKNGSGIHIKNVIEPYAYCCFHNEEEGIQPRYIFTEISKLFDAPHGQ